MIVWNMDPTLLKMGPIEIRYYGVLFGTGILLAYMISRSFFRKKGIPDIVLDKLLIYEIIFLVLGAHFIHLIFYEPKSFIENPIRIVQIGSGLASHGGFLGAVLGLFIFSKRYKINFWEYTDLLVVGGAIVGAFVRLGNFFNSEIYGRVTDSSLGVVFTRRGETLPRHPSQLYEMAITFFVFLLVFIIYKKYWNRLKFGSLFFTWVTLYFTTRFFIEYVKEYQVISKGFPFTMGQMLSAPIALISIAVIIKFKMYKLDQEREKVERDEVKLAKKWDKKNGDKNKNGKQKGKKK